MDWQEFKILAGEILNLLLPKLVYPGECCYVKEIEGELVFDFTRDIKYHFNVTYNYGCGPYPHRFFMRLPKHENQLHTSFELCTIMANFREKIVNRYKNVTCIFSGISDGVITFYSICQESENEAGYFGDNFNLDLKVIDGLSQKIPEITKMFK